MNDFDKIRQHFRKHILNRATASHIQRQILENDKLSGNYDKNGKRLLKGRYDEKYIFIYRKLAEIKSVNRDMKTKSIQINEENVDFQNMK